MQLNLVQSVIFLIALEAFVLFGNFSVKEINEDNVIVAKNEFKRIL